MSEKILVVSTSLYFAENMKAKIKKYDFGADVSIINEPGAITASPEKIRADILFLETNCWYGATPMFISKILEKKKQLTVCVFSYEELPAGAVASFFRFGAAGYLDIRQGLESVHEGIKKILRGYTFVPERYRECVEKTVEEYYDGDALLTSEYWLCRLICFGFELESCAEIMKVKLSTARFYKAQVYKKLNVHNTSSLVEKCRQLGIVKPDDIFENILSDDELKSIYKRRDKIAGEKQLRNYAAAS